MWPELYERRGHLSQAHARARGDVRDSAYYTIVDDEWPDVKANLERRLASRLASG
jgi:hypothetical protein